MQVDCSGCAVPSATSSGGGEMQLSTAIGLPSRILLHSCKWLRRRNLLWQFVTPLKMLPPGCAARESYVRFLWLSHEACKQQPFCRDDLGTSGQVKLSRWCRFSGRYCISRRNGEPSFFLERARTGVGSIVNYIAMTTSRS